MATWEALSSVIAAALVSGGPPCLFYNYVASFLCTICIATSLAEIASIYPTAGGQYCWVAALSPARSKLAASYFTGWISALTTLNDDSYVPKRWQGMLFYWATLLYAAGMNVWGVKAMPHVNLMSGITHIVAFFGTVITLVVMANKNTASFVFAEFVNSSGWDSDAVSWLIGLLNAVYPLLGYDAACHLAEELPDASRNVPLAMIGSVVVNGLMGLVYCILLLFSARSVNRLVDTPTGFPFMEIYLDATLSRVGATIMSLMLVLVAAAATVASTTSTSRTLWAFARDKATPCHEYLSHVSPKLQVPVRAVVLVVALQALLGFMYLGNDAAFNAVLSMAVIGLYLSYILPIAYMFFHGRQNLGKQNFGSFRLRPWLGFTFNVVSMIWMVVVMVFRTFPTTLPATLQRMNYSSVVLAGWLTFGAIYYTIAARHKFEVPVTYVSSIPNLSVSVHGDDKRLNKQDHGDLQFS
ncbi:amino acid permease domain-containing protein [Hirsutella rhossiliensis]|uniref:Amino acid permease domain-containing protein n=1 Tax=Hirsutella rhossiliensis TaxID=111463 RepID=A0A9P8SCZ6_9HYPO|nr:amino acid permease domain-containing protein [Hirsutella rhossiliensis]KAH0958188.1 amino acid permease domain-containing protein [Hirsutella rhossiliensis]